MDKEKLAEACRAFVVDDDLLRETAAAFRRDMREGLAGGDSSTLRMLPSYVGLPTGAETGEFVALDFGGTNVRAAHILLKGNGDFEIIKRVARPLTEPGVYDYVGETAQAEELFDFVADMVDEAIERKRGTKFLLGHTFSFPSEQTNLYNARLITWTKEFATQGVEGEIVNNLLKEALVRIGALNVEPVAVINDTVAVLLAAAYKQSSTYIGSIYATGHNTCYYEPYLGQAAQPMILNMESGGFGKLIPSKYDLCIDEASEKPGEQHLEKMVAGRYLGDLFGLALGDAFGADGAAYGFTSIDLSAIVEDEFLDRHVVQEVVRRKTGQEVTTAEAMRLQELAEAVIARSARLVTATFCGVLWQIAGKGEIEKQHIAVDGSVYEKMPLIQEHVSRALYVILGEDSAKIDIVLENAGSLLGAAIAASMAGEES